jgi:hypothetical protein
MSTLEPLSDTTAIRAFFVLGLIGAAGFLLLGALSSFVPKWPTGKLFRTASSLFALSSLLQLQLCGWFDAVMRRYDNVTEFPYGPPSIVTRQIIDDPDHPLQTIIRNAFFFDPKSGLVLAIFGIFTAIAATWL